ncbi:hypothetical protein KKG90_02530 [Candidatus Bipolaricaulota bacterium]|nr:hypothetical protein [Candidatus Bipolaricaulota bacterium]
MKRTVWVAISSILVLAAAAGSLALRDSWRDSEEDSSAVASEVATGDVASATGGELELVLLAQTAAGTLPVADGVIAADEYRNRLLDPQTGMTLWWQNDATNLYVGLVSPGTGWAGVGFSHRTGKPGSNIIIGAVSNGQVTLRDGYGVTKSLHATDQTSSLLTGGGSEANGQTMLEFSIPLAATDAQDVSLEPGQVVQVILAYQSKKDSLTAEHTRYAMTQIQLD